MSPPLIVRPVDVVVDDRTFSYQEIPDRSSHLFIVHVVRNLQKEMQELRLHVARSHAHAYLAAQRSLEPTTVVGGGGVCCVQQDGRHLLYMGGSSFSYGDIPRTVALQFAAILRGVLEERDPGTHYDDIITDRHDGAVSAFWRNLY